MLERVLDLDPVVAISQPHQAYSPHRHFQRRTQGIKAAPTQSHYLLENMSMSHLCLLILVAMVQITLR